MRVRDSGCFSVNNFIISYFENPFENKIITDNCGGLVLNALFVHAESDLPKRRFPDRNVYTGAHKPRALQWSKNSFEARSNST